MKKILIIEDEKNFALALSELLKVEGFDVAVAENGLDGLQEIKANPVDLVILDVMMPKIDGYKVCRLIKFDKKYKSIPVILLTARCQDEDIAIGEQCGANAYILKSGSPDILILKVKELLK